MYRELIEDFPVAYNQVPIDPRHEKTDLKVFVVVIPKEGWARILWA